MFGLAGRCAYVGGSWLLMAAVPAMTFMPGSPAAHQWSNEARPHSASGAIHRFWTAGQPPALAWVPPGMWAPAGSSFGQIQGARDAATAGGLLGDLDAVTSLTPTDAWAVGGRCAPDCLDAVHTLIRHWNGRVWTTVPSPNPSRVVDQLISVSADSTRDAWAVGDNFRQTEPGTQEAGTLTLHWNGHARSKIASPKVGTDETALTGMSALTSTNVWAVGSDATSGGKTLTLILHWNGRAWSRVVSPNPSRAFSSLTGVHVVTARDAWAVGLYLNLKTGRTETLLVHWNGRTWTRVRSPNPSTAGNGLFAVSATSASDVWAVGGYCTRFCGGTAEVDGSLIMHWNGRAWTRVASPNPGVLQAVSARSSANAWAAGNFCSSRCGRATETDRSVTMHWNGRAWSKVLIPHAGTRHLAGISTSSAANAWTVGSPALQPARTGSPPIVR